MATLLIVDDDNNIRDTLHELFSSSYECHAADRAEQALAYLEVENYDVVLTDISMPGLVEDTVVRAIARRQELRTKPQEENKNGGSPAGEAFRAGRVVDVTQGRRAKRLPLATLLRASGLVELPGLASTAPGSQLGARGPARRFCNWPKHADQIPPWAFLT
ncbi:MAG: response regulator [Acidobacteria bacterium]|nr:response regulator [Acidobacteriota bacterium]